MKKVVLYLLLVVLLLTGIYAGLDRYEGNPFHFFHSCRRTSYDTAICQLSAWKLLIWLLISGALAYMPYRLLVKR